MLLFPSRRAGDESWTDSYLRQTTTLLNEFISRFSVDTNRIYAVGGSEGFQAAWDMIAMKPGFFAGAFLMAGWQGKAPSAAIKEVPIWAWCAQDDDAGLLPSTWQAVSSLRLAGGKLPYTKYVSGRHFGGIFMGLCTPVIVDWLLAQRRGLVSMAEPLLSITHPTTQTVWSTGAKNADLAGAAIALGQNVTQVAWTNVATKLSGIAPGSNVWRVTGIPLAANRTNTIIVTASTTSWSAGYGGHTTFNNTLPVACYPIRAALRLQGAGATLDWTGGGPPYRMQRMSNLAAGNWTDIMSNAASPVAIFLDWATGFYRIISE